MLHVFYHRKNGGQIKKKMGKKISIQYYLCCREAHLEKKKIGSPYSWYFPDVKEVLTITNMYMALYSL